MGGKRRQKAAGMGKNATWCRGFGGREVFSTCFPAQPEDALAGVLLRSERAAAGEWKL